MPISHSILSPNEKHPTWIDVVSSKTATMVLFGVLAVFIFLILLVPENKAGGILNGRFFTAAVAFFFINLGAVLYRRFYRETNLSRVMVGSMVMHASMSILLVGAILSAALRAESGILLTEGQTAPAGDLMPNRNLTLEKMDVVRNRRGDVLDLSARLFVRSVEKGEQRLECKVNHPARLSGAWLYLKRYGMSPCIQIVDVAGKVVFRSFVNFDLIVNKADFLELPELGIILKVQRMSKDDSNFRLSVKDETGKYKVSAPEIRRWAEFKVIRDPGFGFAAAGCAGVLGGMMLRVMPVLKRKREPSVVAP